VEKKEPGDLEETGLLGIQVATAKKKRKKKKNRRREGGREDTGGERWGKDWAPPWIGDYF